VYLCHGTLSIYITNNGYITNVIMWAVVNAIFTLDSMKTLKFFTQTEHLINDILKLYRTQTINVYVNLRYLK